MSCYWGMEKVHKKLTLISTMYQNQRGEGASLSRNLKFDVYMFPCKFFNHHVTHSPYPTIVSFELRLVLLGIWQSSKIWNRLPKRFSHVANMYAKNVFLDAITSV